MLQIEGLRAGYADLEILHGIDLEVREGEVVALIGAEQLGRGGGAVGQLDDEVASALDHVVVREDVPAAVQHHAAAHAAAAGTARADLDDRGRDPLDEAREVIDRRDQRRCGLAGVRVSRRHHRRGQGRRAHRRRRR